MNKLATIKKFIAKENVKPLLWLTLVFLIILIIVVVALAFSLSYSETGTWTGLYFERALM